MAQIYQNLTPDEITQLEFQAGKKATEMIDKIISEKLSIQLSTEDNGKILQVGADGKVVPMTSSEGLTIDDTLSVSNAAADAKATGDAIAVAEAALAPTFSTSTAYTAGQYVWHDGKLYRFTTDHAAGSWNAAQVELAVVTNAIPTVDDTLSVQGAAADAKKTGDKISDLKSHVNVNLGEWIQSITNYNDWHNIDFTGDYNSGDKLYIHAFETDDVNYYNIVGYNGASSTTLFANQTDAAPRIITINAAFDKIRIAYKCNTVATVTMSAIVKKIDSNATDVAGQLASMIELNNDTAAKMDNVMDSPFTVAVPASIKGIVAFEFLDYDAGFETDEIEQYRLSRYYYKASGFYIFLQLQKCIGGVWSTFDSITIVTANAPTETKLMILEGDYHRFRVAYLPDMLTASSIGSVEYPIKNVSRQPFITSLQNQVNTITNELQYGSYENQDAIKHVVHVDPNGNGDYTTIAAAYAAITDSSYVNQYEVILEPGTYEEYNLICPAYTHTHGYDWKTTIVTSENVSGSTLPVFDQKLYPSKLSNITIISGTGYCIHNDYAFINTGAVFNENLYCKKVYGESVANFAWKSKTNPAIIGAGAQYNGTKIIYNNCVFEDGAVTCHSNSSSLKDGNFHLVLKNCKAVNAYVQLMMAGNSGAAEDGLWICEIDGFTVPVGCPALVTKVGARNNDETAFGWQIIGGNNNNFAVILDNTSDTLTTDVPWNNINTNEKVFCQAVTAIAKGQWITDTLTVADSNENEHNVFGVALADASIGETFPVWIGKAYAVTGTNGEYGIGANGVLSASATEKIGKIISNIFYRY